MSSSSSLRYCLNGATCFTVKIADSILYNCECADGYMGQRCEFKDLDGTYLREYYSQIRLMLPWFCLPKIEPLIDRFC